MSDTRCSKANEYARNHGLRQFSVYQGYWNAASREFEREIIPMCRAEGMGICPWGSLGGGKFKTEQQRHFGEGCNIDYRENEIRACRALEVVADRRSTSMSNIALAYVMLKAPYVFPVVGCRKTEYLKSSIEALTIQLTDDEIKEIDSEVPLDWGFPHNLLWAGGAGDSYQDVWLLRTGGHFDYVKNTKVNSCTAIPAAVRLSC